MKMATGLTQPPWFGRKKFIFPLLLLVFLLFAAIGFHYLLGCVPSTTSTTSTSTTATTSTIIVITRATSTIIAVTTTTLVAPKNVSSPYVERLYYFELGDNAYLLNLTLEKHVYGYYSG
jgi:hypothetical protein